MPPSDEESNYDEEESESMESSDDMEYVSINSDSSSEESSEDETPRVSDRQLLLHKLSQFEQNKSPIETLVFTNKKHHDIKDVHNDLQRELSLFDFSHVFQKRLNIMYNLLKYILYFLFFHIVTMKLLKFFVVGYLHLRMQVFH